MGILKQINKFFKKEFEEGGRISLGTSFPVQKTLELLTQCPWKKYAFFSLNGQLIRVKTRSQRYRLFYQNRKCVCCGRKGNTLSLEINHESLNRNESSFHFNLYCKEGDNYILMTKDHIIPRAKGGKDNMVNYQTMCSECNSLKADLIPEEFSALQV